MTFVYRCVFAVCPACAGHIAAMPPLRGGAAQDRTARPFRSHAGALVTKPEFSAALGTNQFPQCALRRKRKALLAIGAYQGESHGAWSNG
jgi:hypothetical protein